MKTRIVAVTGVGEVDVAREILGPEGTLVDARSSTDRPRT